MEGLCTVQQEIEAIGTTTIGGRVLTFGHCHGSQQKQQHVLTIYTMLVDGSKYYFNYDVSGMMHEIEPEKPDDPEVPEGPAHIVIDIPKLPVPLPTHSGGFQAEMGDWEEREIDVAM